mgnify:CR=1 FL=1
MGNNTMYKPRLSDAYRQPGYIPLHAVQQPDNEPSSRVITLKRIQKKAFASAEKSIGGTMTGSSNEYVISHAGNFLYTLSSKCVV